MASLSAHLREPGDHGRLQFHPLCAVCCEDRLAGRLPSDAIVTPRTQALLAAGVLAFSGAAPTSVLAAGSDQEGQGGTEPSAISADPWTNPDSAPGATDDPPVDPASAAPVDSGDDDAGPVGPDEAELAPAPGEVAPEPETTSAPAVVSTPTTNPPAVANPRNDGSTAADPESSTPAPAGSATGPGGSVPATGAPDTPTGVAPPAVGEKLTTGDAAPATSPAHTHRHGHCANLRAGSGETRAAVHRQALAATPTSPTSPASRAYTYPASAASRAYTSPASRAYSSPAVSRSSGMSTQVQRAPAAARVAAVAHPVRVAAEARAAKRARAGDRVHVVLEGESLWSVSSDVLDGRATVAQVAREVNRLWTLNAARIGTGDRDLLPVGTRLDLR